MGFRRALHGPGRRGGRRRGMFGARAGREARRGPPVGDGEFNAAGQAVAHGAVHLVGILRIGAP